MKRFFEKFLITVLWLMTITLLTTFWMNIKYGFNVFAGTHWEYLSMAQANGTQIKFDFYASLIIAIIIAVSGLYFILRPRGNTMVTHPTNNIPNSQTKSVVSPTIPQSPKPDSVVPQHPTVSPTNRPTRPPMMMTGARNVQPQQPQNHFVAPTTNLQPPTAVQSNKMFDEITNLFESNGYIIKNCKRINKLINPVMAVAYDQTIWLSVANTPPDIVQDAIETLIAIFDDTLGETANDITVRGCIIDANGGESPNPDLISIFENIDELKSFVTPNTKPDDYDQDLFDAFSTYISTVAGYIGK